MDKDRRLLIATETLGFGGTETHLVRLLPRLARSGWRIAVFCLSDRGARASLLEDAEIEVSAPGQKANGRSPVELAQSAARLMRLVRRFRPQIAHFYLPGPYLIGAPITISARVPINVMSRRSLAHYQAKRPLLARAERLLHTRMDALTGNAQVIVEELLAEGVPAHKATLIYNGIEPQPLPARASARQELGLTPEAFVGVMVATLHSYKRHRDAIDAFAAVKDRLPPGWQLLCAGRDEGLRDDLRAQLRAQGLEGNVHLLGERSDVGRLLSAADYYLVTSDEEGLSNAVLEAMDAGLPTIVTDVGGNPEVVVHDETGLIVSPGDVDAISTAIMKLAVDPSLRQRLGAAGKQRVASNFSLDACVASHANFYEALLTKAGLKV